MAVRWQSVYYVVFAHGAAIKDVSMKGTQAAALGPPARAMVVALVPAPERAFTAAAAAAACITTPGLAYGRVMLPSGADIEI